VLRAFLIIAFFYEKTTALEKFPRGRMRQSFCWQERLAGCRPPGDNLQHSAQRTPCRLSPTQPPSERLPTLPRFLKHATKLCCTPQDFAV